MAIKLIKACKDLNIGMRMLVAHCAKHGISVPFNPNHRLDDDTYLLLAKEFSPSIAKELEAKYNPPSPNSLPVNHGKPWDEELVNELRSLADEGKPLGEIAQVLSRTINSIEMKLIGLGYTLSNPEENQQNRVYKIAGIKEMDKDMHKEAVNTPQKVEPTTPKVRKLSDEQVIQAQRLMELLSETEGMSLNTLVFTHNFELDEAQNILEILCEQGVARYDKINKLWYLLEKKNFQEENDKNIEDADDSEDEDAQMLPDEKTVEQVQEIVTDSIEKMNLFASHRVSPLVAARYWITQNAQSSAYWLMTSGNYPATVDAAIRKTGGRTVTKNSLLGVQLQTTQVGNEFVIHPRVGRLDNHVHNSHVLHNREIHIENDPKPYNYRGYQSLVDFMQFLKKTQDDYEKTIADIERLEQERKNAELTAVEKGKLTRDINKMKEAKRELAGQRDDLLLLSNYIREQGSLRYNPVLDTKQTAIKTENLYDGTTLIIDGGPGTGKTTTMIQRLKYLTDIAAIEEDFTDNYGRFKLKTEQREDLINRVKNNQDWMFFSPSRLLKLYLADAMNKDGLVATNEKVWDWNDFRKMALSDYGLFGVGKSYPFSNSPEKKELIYASAQPEKMFLDYLRKCIIGEISQLPVINATDDAGINNNVRTIARALNGIEDDSLEGIILRLNDLSHIQLERTVDVEAELSSIADDLYGVIANDEDLIEMLEDIQLQDDAIEYDRGETENDLHFLLKNWLRIYCNNILYQNNDALDEYKEVLDLLGVAITTIDAARLGRIRDGLLYENYQAYTKGVHRIILKRLPKYYKSFRKYLIDQHLTEDWDVDLLAQLIKKDKKQLHFQEQALLLLVINHLILTIRRVLPNQTIKHRYISSYNELVRPIIGIDEATDFSKVELQAIVSFALQDYNSITMAGDLMQRLTVTGIQNWEVLDDVVPNKKIVELRTSYRQSKRMLEVAQQLYSDTIGEKPNYVPKLQENKVPRPLIYTSDNETKKVKWIEKRIEEVYKAYSKQRPATAIFLNAKEDVTPFVEEMQKSATLQNAGIDVVDGSAGNSRGSKQEIWVYPIDVVKGLEFDVVFFHNIDSAGFDNETIKRYIYVGVSRAAFFLGATMSQEVPEISQYFSKQKNWKTFMDDVTPQQQTSIDQNDVVATSTISPIDELILKAIPVIPNETSGVSNDILLKVAAKYLEKFRKQVVLFESSKLHKDKPDMRQSRQLPVICDMLSKESARELWGNRYPAYKVYFILCVYMRMPFVHHSWWENTFANGICEYLEWSPFFRGSKQKIDHIIKEIEKLN